MKHNIDTELVGYELSYFKPVRTNWKTRTADAIAIILIALVVGTAAFVTALTFLPVGR